MKQYIIPNPDDGIVRCSYRRGTMSVSAEANLTRKTMSLALFSEQEGVIAHPVYDPGPMFNGEVGYLQHVRSEQQKYYNRMHDELDNDNERLYETRRLLSHFMQPQSEDPFSHVAQSILQKIVEAIRVLKGANSDNIAQMIAAASLDDLSLDSQVTQLFLMGDRMVQHAEGFHDDPVVLSELNIVRNSISHITGKLSATSEALKKMIRTCHIYYARRHGESLPDLEMVHSDIMPVIMAARTKIFGDIVVYL